jgi:AraC-like DNA-binding protein
MGAVSSKVLAKVGVDLSQLVNPESRIPHRVMMDLLSAFVALTGDSTLGLRAGESMEPGDLDTIEYAARTSSTWREAIQVCTRYMHLLNQAAEVSLLEGPDEALWRFRITDGVAQPPAANDFVIASALAFTRRYAPPAARPPLAVHFMHAEPPYAAEYRKRFDGEILFSMPHNGLVVPRSNLDEPMPMPEPAVHSVFEARAREQAERLGTDLTSRVKEIVLEQLATRRPSMTSAARRLATSVPTLRRRLEEEGTSFSAILKDARQSQAAAYLRDRRLTIAEIAYRLGFAHAPAFSGAFRRWTGVTASDYRRREDERQA